MTEPCPNCENRINPHFLGGFKRCPRCGFTWVESGFGAVAVR